MGYSDKWQNWVAILDFKTCLPCREKHGTIYALDEVVFPDPPLHMNCRCSLKRMKTLTAGSATNLGLDGADWYLKQHGKLPDYYISKNTAKTLGWKSSKGNLNSVAPEKMLFGIYKNKEGKLPNMSNRIWYEADINYTTGYRNKERILFSNDGLIFVTQDHCKTFTEII